MKIRRFATCAIALVLVSAVGAVQATTIGFIGAAAVNADLPTDYGSNATTDGAGWTTSDGTGATPNVALYWGGSPDSTGWDWEFHSAGTFQHVEALNAGGAWDAANPPSSNGVAQLQSQASAPHAINFSVPAGVSVVLNSLDLGNATDQTTAEGPYGFDLALIRDSDASTVWTYSTALWDVEADPPVSPRGAREESIAINYTGAPGESYTLTFTRTGQGSGITWRTGLDNLSFSQIPEPTSIVLAALCGLGALVVRKRL